LRRRQRAGWQEALNQAAEGQGQAQPVGYAPLAQIDRGCDDQQKQERDEGKQVHGIFTRVCREPGGARDTAGSSYMPPSSLFQRASTFVPTAPMMAIAT